MKDDRVVTMPNRPDFHALMHRFEERLPDWIARTSRYLRQPSAMLWRIPAAAVLIVGGILGFLPILGFWMVPLGLLLLAVDIPLLRPPLVRLLHWIEQKWPASSRKQPDPVPKGEGRQSQKN